MNFNEMELKYWKLKKDIGFQSFINPLNIYEEKEIFLEKYKNKQKYNPKFKYNIKKLELKNFLFQLEEIYKLLIQEYKSHLLFLVYEKLINEDITKIKFQLNSNEKEYAMWLTSLYSIPKTSLQDSAKSILNDLKNDNDNKKTKTYDADSVAKIFRKMLDIREMKNWKVEVVTNPARMSIDALNKKVKINKNAIFDENEIKRLEVHEIDTHILRSENGSKMPFLIFKYGFPDYLETEEGLAIYSEYKTGLMLNRDLKKYALRVLATSNVKKPFYEIFKILVNYLNENDAFDMTTRVKRGLVDTSLSGGYTKDQVYLQGFLTLKEMTCENIKKLYVGKVDKKFILEHYNLFSKYSTDIKYPSWINNNEKYIY